MGDDEELVGLCEGRFVGLQAAFSLGGGGSMLAKDLNSYTEATLMALAEKDAPVASKLLLPWLDETGLRRRLRDYQSPTLAKKVKSEGSNSLVLEPLDTGEESQGEQHFSFRFLLVFFRRREAPSHFLLQCSSLWTAGCWCPH